MRFSIIRICIYLSRETDGDAGNFERLYDQEQDLLLAERFDTRVAGIRLLGRDMAKMADHETAEVVRRILKASSFMAKFLPVS